MIDHDVLEIEGTTIGSTYGTELGEVVGVVGVFVEGNGLTEVEPLAPELGEEGFVLLTLAEGWVEEAGVGEAEEKTGLLIGPPITPSPYNKARVISVNPTSIPTIQQQGVQRLVYAYLL